MPCRPLFAVALILAALPAQAQFFHIGSGSIDGSLCLGNDCTGAEAFGFDTLRLKENNLRIDFTDTSNTASFPTQDWQLVANESTNGGLNAFWIQSDAPTGSGNRVFLVEAGARNNALYVENSGEVGIGTNNPVADVHIKIGDTPTVRLEQDATSGFNPQTWDMAGNETNWFIRDATTGSRLPLRIRPGAATSSIDIDSDGNVRIGHANTAGAKLHLRRTDGSAQILVEETGAAGSSTLLRLTSNARPIFEFENASVAADEGLWRASSANNGDFEINNVGDTSGVDFDLAPGGDLTIGGMLTENSDRHNKLAIEPVDPAEILSKVAALPVASWTYRHDADEGIRHIGPMAQDFRALFGTGHTDTGISTLDVSGVALAAIQALSRQNADLQRRLDAMERRMAAE